MEKTQKSLVCFCNKVEVCTGGFVTDKTNATNLYLGADEFWVEDKRQKKNNGRLRQVRALKSGRSLKSGQVN